MGFFASKTLLSAVELGLFTVLAEEGPMTGAEIAAALGFLERTGEGPGGLYANTAETALFLDRENPAYIGGILEMANARLYRFWGDLTEALTTGKPQNEVKHSGEPLFARLYQSPERLEQFMNAMAGISAGDFKLLAERFAFSRYRTLCDVGGATAQLACFVAEAQPHMRCTSFDLPAVEPIARRRVERMGLQDRVSLMRGDFFAEPLPKADVITMARILHDWNLEKKKVLIRKAYDALPPGGAFIVVESLIDDARRENAFGLMMSLNMLIETGDGFDYTGADFTDWCREAGFREFEFIKLAGASSAGIAYK
jgi:ubiquinone/menaquinone biosynthesis C-methylase UbiE